jgi:hypothetical protein
MVLNTKILKIFFILILALSFGKNAFAQQTVFKPVSQNGGSTIQYENKSFNIGGVGAALSGCLGIGSKVSNLSILTILDFKPGSDVSVDDTQARRKESCGDSLAYAASRVVINNMSKKVTTWATSGNNGNPYYPTDYKSFYQNIKSDQVSSFITQLQSADGSNPYSSAFAKSLAAKARSEAESFTDKYKYTGPSASFFKDNSGFNWEDWYKYLQPQNNSLGYSQIATQQIKKLEDQALQATKDELANNSGFLSQKVCDDKSFKEIVNDSEKAKLLAAAAKGDKSAITTLGNSVCKDFKTSTPGAIIAQQLKDVLGSPLRQTEQVDEINEALGSVFDNMVSRMINKGISSLSDKNFKNNVDFSYDTSVKNSNNNVSAQNPGYNLPTGGSFWDQYNTNFDLHRDLPGIIKTQEDYLAQLNKTTKVLGLVLTSIDEMDVALPGPHIGWANGMVERIYTAAAGIKREAQLEMGGILGNLKTLGMRDKLLDGIEGIFIKVFTGVFGFYENMITNKFDPSINTKMPSPSVRMITLISSKQAYEETYSANTSEIKTTGDLIVQLKDINNQVITLYKKACARFKKENPGSSCIY